MARAAEGGKFQIRDSQRSAVQGTIQNSCYSMQMARKTMAGIRLVVSSASHLPRAGIITDQLPLQWRTHPAHSIQRISA